MKSSIASKKKKVLVKKKPEKKIKEQMLTTPSGEIQSQSIIEIKKEKPPFIVVAIGASAGGLEAITLLLKNLSPETGMAFIYVQHLSPDHKSLLTSILSKLTKMKVQEVDDMEKMEPNNLYIIPHNKEIEVTDGHIKLIPRPKNKSTNLSIDVLFTSLAEARKENVIGVVLSGSASDGTRGLSDIKKEGGITFAQDNSAKFGSMPQSAIAAGVVDFVMSPIEIANELNQISKHPLLKRTSVHIAPEDQIENSNPDLKSLLQLIFKKKNVDFSHYKMNTIKRRMLRRMLICKIKTLKQYAGVIAKNEEEFELLYNDLLINVTEFFRDDEAFLILKKTILPKLLKSKKADETLRIWVAGCSTGEEVYSIAMMLRELQGNKNNHTPFQIFASDLSASVIEIARSGEYSPIQLKNVSPKRLQQFFTKANDKYTISKSLRDTCVFAQHNILRDPPFSRMDFISCRNLLIYLDVFAQRKVISTLHYALNEGGCLMLGKSETIGSSEELFTTLNKTHKFYTRKKNPGIYRLPDISTRISQISKSTSKANTHSVPKKANAVHNNLGIALDAILLEKYLPASVIINHDLEILQFRGNTEKYLRHNTGKASFNILKMAKPEITFELKKLIEECIKSKQSVRNTGFELANERANNISFIANLEVAPLILEGEEPMMVIVFTGQQLEMPDNFEKNDKNTSAAKDLRIKKLEEGLSEARSELWSITHNHETINEEYQSANEEIVSSNEELQSLNEELETSKEEIESTNEELTTSNQELQARNIQVEDLYNYYEEILSTFQEPMLVLNSSMQIKTANKAFYHNFQINENNCIGISLFKISNNQWDIPELRKMLDEVLPKNIQIKNFEIALDFPNLGLKKLLLNAHRILKKSNNEELIVLTILDLTEVRKLEIELQEKEKKSLEKQLETEQSANKITTASNKRYDLMLMQSPFAFAVLKGKDMVVSLANDSMKEIWGHDKEILGKSLFEILPELKGGPIPDMLRQVYETGIPLQGYELLVPMIREGKLKDVYFNFVYQPYLEANETISGVTIISYEVTNHVKIKDELIEAKKIAERKTSIAEEATKSKQQFLSNMSHEIRTPMNAIVGFTKVVLKTELSAKQREYLTAIKLSGDALILLINDILDLAKVDSGKMTFDQSPFSLSESISSMFLLFEQKVQENNTEFVLEFDKNIPKIVLGDALRLRQILLNLLSNSIKFTSGGKINVIVNLIEQNKESVTIEFKIIDTGIGIPKNKLEKIFENFQQVSAGTSKLYGGTGLGLAIVKQLVELQGGQIMVESELDKGSTFIVRMNFNKTKEKIKKTKGKITLNQHSKTLKVLVAEDIALNQLLMKTLLDDFGFEGDFASNGKITIEKLKSNTYDIILMDLQMPEMNGFEATSYIRNKLKLDIPIIALTADITTVDLVKCKEAGMNDYISKPLDENILYKKMLALVNHPLSDINLNLTKNGISNINSINESKQGYTNLEYLKNITRSKPEFIKEMIEIYLKQTPEIISIMLDSLENKNWVLLEDSIHKLLPSFAIVGIDIKYHQLATKIQEKLNAGEINKELYSMVGQLEDVCLKACKELDVELKKMLQN